MVKVVATSISHLERIVEQLSLCGPASTSIVYSKPLERHTITRKLLERAKDPEEEL
ncbi:hypothetical protein [Dictyobacter vulcani]|nr:hypothetical protein [Dictyobacter vulcani]